MQGACALSIASGAAQADSATAKGSVADLATPTEATQATRPQPQSIVLGEPSATVVTPAEITSGKVLSPVRLASHSA